MLLVKSTIDADMAGSAERRVLSDSRLCGKASSFSDFHAVFIAVLSMAGKNESDKKFVKEKKEWQRNLLRWY